MRLILLLAFAVAARADVDSLQLRCPDEIDGKQWTMYRDNTEASCLIEKETEKTFEEAFEECGKIGASLVSFAHKRKKIEFVNNLIIKKTGKESTLWFFDKRGLHRQLMDKIPEKDEWLVLETSKDPAKIKLMINPVKVGRHFICEAPAQPVPQRPKFALEPEDLQISQDVLDTFNVPMEDKDKDKDKDEEKGKGKEGKEPKPLIATFNCRPFAMPKPEVRWVMVYEHKDNSSLLVKPIDAEKIVDPRKPLRHVATDELKFFDLRRDCKAHRCSPKSMQEPSQLIMIGTQLFDRKYSIACVASNEIGTAMSREAQIIINQMEHFDKEEQVYTVPVGTNVTIPCELETEPDSASVEWVRLPNKGEPPMERPLEQINKQTAGGIQMSKSTFEMLIDFATPEFSGRYACNVRMHNGRMGHVIRKRIIVLEVEPCRDCDFSKKPVDVAPGFPAWLSMNPMSNQYIREGDDFLMECPCFGKRAPEEMLSVEWNIPAKDPQQLPMLPEGSALLIRDAKKELSGSFECRCTRGEEKSEWSTAEISIVPAIAPTNHVDVVETGVGQTAALICQLPVVEMEGILVNVTPMRGAASLLDWLREKNDDRFRLSATGGKYVIEIQNVKPEDAGDYGCRVHINYFNKWMDVDTYYTTLKVTKPE